MRDRRRRREPAWPLALFLGTLALGAAAILLPERLEEGAVSRAAPSGSAQVEGEGTEEVEPTAMPLAWDRIRVEVLNGGGIPGMAGRARDRLRDEGFDVVYFGNAPSFGTEASTVLSRAGESEAALAVARVLGIEGVVIEPDPARLVEVTVLLGTDWEAEGEGEGRAPPPEGSSAGAGDGTEAGPQAWWDVRRLLDWTR